ncbi:phage major capsid protein [Methylocystis parvus]|uniref:phage major capsid protein n=1 Tax=Methylocystis parvus TaxID=134 RepID=UPI003C73C4BE
MAKSIQALREDRARLATEYQALAKAENFTKEIQAQAESKLAEIERVDAQIAAINNAIALTGDEADEFNARAASNEDGRSVDENTHRVKQAKAAFIKALRYGAGALNTEESALVAADDPRNRSRIQNVAEGASATGGVFVPTIVMPTVLEYLKAFGGMRAVAWILSTAGGNPFSWGTIDDTAAEGEIVAEGVTASDDDLAFGSVSVGAYKFSSKTIPVSMEILQDAAVNVEAIVLKGLATRIARGQNRYFTTGSGVGQPQGVVTASPVGYTAPVGNTTSLAYDFFQELFHSVDPAYRDNATWMMHDTTWKKIKQLKDANGRPIFLPSVEAAFAGGVVSGYQIEGRPIVINQHMAVPAADAKSILFGDFSKNMIRDVMDVLILRFTDSAYGKKGQVGFLGWARADGRMIDAKDAAQTAFPAIKAFQHSAT